MRAIQDFPDYFVNEAGEVISLKAGKPVSLVGQTTNSGYRQVALWNGPKPKHVYVHRLVAETFFGKSSLHVNHKNGVKTDNSLSTLEYVTRSENTKHAYASGLMKRGDKNKLSKLLDSEVELVKALKGEMLQKDLAQLLGVSKSLISIIQRGEHRV
jgi:uncharacterized membrane protein